jgi:hypothetical protein
MTKLDYWLLFFPDFYCRSIMLPEMNKKLDPGRPPIEWWEYLCWLGIWRHGRWPRPLIILVNE